MRRATMAMVLGLAIGAPAGAWAQATQPPTAGTAAAPSEKTVKLVQRVLKASHIERQVDTLMAAMMPVMMEQQVKQHPNLSAEDQKLIADVARRVLNDKFVPKLLDRSVPIYASIYTDEELEAMASFYESPVGQSILAKTQQVAPKVAQVTRELLPDLTAEMTSDVVHELCSRTNCLQTPAAPPKTRPS